MPYCDTTSFVAQRRARVATQYREASNLVWLLEQLVSRVKTPVDSLCDVRSAFDIDTATGHQLTVVGNWLGWPRTHCSGRKLPVFGFTCSAPGACGPRDVVVKGFCEDSGKDANWRCTDKAQLTEYTFTDDELYRRFLKARVLALQADYTLAGVAAAATALFGADVAVLDDTPGTVSVYTGRVVTDAELEISHLFRHVLPVSPGIAVRVYESDGRVFGFGAGWGDLCTGGWSQLLD